MKLQCFLPYFLTASCPNTSCTNGKLNVKLLVDDLCKRKCVGSVWTQ